MSLARFFTPILTALLVATTFALPELNVVAGSLPNAELKTAKAKDLTLVCPGELFRSGGSSGTQIGVFDPVGSAGTRVYFADPVGVSLEVANGSYTAQDPSGRAVQGSTLLSVLQTQVITGSSMAGLAAASCQQPATNVWLLGGSTALGREALLVLRNPGNVDSTVSLKLYSEAGELASAALSGIAVPAGKTTVFNLSAVAPKTKTFVVQVLAKGGAIGAWIQQKAVRGLIAGGVDYVMPSQPAQLRQVITGLFIRGSKDAAELAANATDYQDLAPVLRVFVPGDQAATFTAQVVGATANTFGTVLRQQVAGGTVAEFELAGLLDGDYAIILESDQPIQVAAKVSRTFKAKNPNTDFAWLPSLPALTAKQIIPVPQNGISKLSLYSTSSQTLQTIELPKGANFALPETDQPMFASLVLDIDGSLAVIPVMDYKNSGGTVAVSLR
ncbi:DUF5719 family protein [Candidatus Rhodoluna planktonica]|uniref:Uncharacterized protein n=1 Tax=Candidatus Rhodoluna planktonica TaxID=535712 RepID=A0A1D9DZZ3_9MICO|nr:DUF5719 family protein [Candidatus Rhodoluna planktonica]AOY56374.1 hypothetical protein A4Z71_05330 [Candidatus Rhodoluna planktonica]